VQRVVDVRTAPGSRRHPQFRREGDLLAYDVGATPPLPGG